MEKIQKVTVLLLVKAKPGWVDQILLKIALREELLHETEELFANKNFIGSAFRSIFELKEIQSNSRDQKVYFVFSELQYNPNTFSDPQ